MKFEKLVKEPEAITFITTYKCNSACGNCCFQCSPQRKECLSLHQIVDCLEQVKTDFPTVKMLILTGGECTLLSYLSQLINIANKEYGLSVRIVTNASWASSYVKARMKIAEWKALGLSEINFSTGDEHLEYVPIENIKNAIIASVDEEYVPFINVEALEGHKFTAGNFLNDERLCQLLKENKIFVMNGVWINFKNPSAEIDGDGILNCINQRCSNLFNNITITPDYRLKACCGITSNYIRYLDLGNLAKYSIRRLYDNQFLDFMKIWMAVEGPHKIMDFVRDYDAKIKKEQYERKHPCQVCAMIFNNSSIMNEIRLHYKRIYSNVIMKYVINS